METICIRCGESFETDNWNVDVCPDCEMELAQLEQEETSDFEYEDTSGIDFDDDF